MLASENFNMYLYFHQRVFHVRVSSKNRRARMRRNAVEDEKMRKKNRKNI